MYYTVRKRSQPLHQNLRVGLIGAGLGGPGLLRLPPLVLVHQLRQVGGLFRVANDKLMLEQLFGSRPLWGHKWRAGAGQSVSEWVSEWRAGGRRGGAVSHKAGLLVEAGLHKLFERFAVVALQRWRVVLWDEEENLHGVQLRVRRLALRQLDGRDAQRPDVGLEQNIGELTGGLKTC